MYYKPCYYKPLTYPKLLHRNPAIYLAQFEQPNQNEKWNLKKDIQVGPLDQHQHELFQQMLAQNADICSKSQMDIGQTNVLKHSINTENKAPYAHPVYSANPIKKAF
jgi:hypothetical protein